ncbi:MAG: DUF2007 domain-containing protein [Burkholderiaceae bacterium]|nr:DUF2007 domain-containing protein [Burkholderiaceae bacterium]MDZ4145805.1 DUF2007 domain-containing protein [Burkholderiales bacterium]
MKRLTQAPNAAIATLWADTLREAGIEASVERQFLGGAAGFLPPSECLPELWLRDDEQFDRAKELLDALQNLPQQHWRCSCGELIEGGFEQCWSCGKFMPVS